MPNPGAPTHVNHRRKKRSQEHAAADRHHSGGSGKAPLDHPMVNGAAPRVVNVSSAAHTIGKIRFDDLQGERHYHRWLAYGQSKLANLLFTYELQRRLRASGSKVLALACHPGYAATNLQHVGPQLAGNPFLGLMTRLGNALMAQSAEAGA